MNLLSKIKTKLGLKPTSTGHILGTSSSSTSNTSTTLNNINNNEKNLFEEYYVTFNSISLGLTIISAPSDHPYYGSPMIQLIQQHSEGYQHIQIGDVILAIETNEGSLNYGDFIEIIKGLERPLTLKFARVPYIPSNTSKSSRKLTDDEKNNQREAMVNAALSREKAWEKRVNTASSTRRKKVLFSSYIYLSLSLFVYLFEIFLIFCCFLKRKKIVLILLKKIHLLKFKMKKF